MLVNGLRIDFDGTNEARIEFVASTPLANTSAVNHITRSSSEHTWYRHKTISSESFSLSIGDKAFFVGNGNSWRISLARTFNSNSNNIFYGDVMEGGLSLNNEIYDLETWQTECLRFGADIPYSQPRATWITPSLTPSTFRAATLDELLS
ncbi:hypothetical protein TIFTF001_056838 [Ficus carica]|uniref:Uncharacterized protein n=1 Tax=Ficus carica TaxID=3494 RepID=A0AA88EI12_FICCA|nr:hypothetical protein TIFTF001_056838 [Ficus carica]